MRIVNLSYAAILSAFFVLFCCAGCGGGSSSGALSSPADDYTGAETLDMTPPATTVKLMFIHHSTGSYWIRSGDNDPWGGLGRELNDNNFYVTESDYGWDAEIGDNLGDRTDTVNWPEWFNDTTMPYVYQNASHFDYPDNTIADPGGENEIIMFKSCYPNSEVGDSIDDEKDIYNSLLSYFEAHADKMFVLIIPPPEITISSAALTRELSNWLVDRDNGWLADYAETNVYAFNYYNVLTDPNNHHWLNDGIEENIVSTDLIDPAHPDELYYPTGDSHPSSEGHQKATAEFVPLLIGWYNFWVNN
ncbi:hypothetical protein [uncultured Desulfuromusa sp.]|uniref:hypothetical protein n=1 Tax=uncultured Desulfuromusa sp. TaxID=219183 RepID=UPI002AA5EC72|nr:hypothetical protein [uncultured Desulfuromusa sp.]